MNSISVTLNDRLIRVPCGTTIMEAAAQAGIAIPSLCYLKDYNQPAACRMCIVEVKGAKGPVTACDTKVAEGMKIQTESEFIRSQRKMNLELICSNHRQDCTNCQRFPYCDLHRLCREYGIDDRIHRFSREPEIDASAPHMIRDQSKCILCRRCISVCEKIQGVCAEGITGRGFDSHISAGALDLPLAASDCINCGQCLAVCPTGALMVKDDMELVVRELNQRKKHVLAIVSPELGQWLGTCFRLPGKDDETLKMSGLLHKIGFQGVFNLNAVAAKQEDLLRAELETHTFEGKLPMITADCPAWLNFCSARYPQLEKYLSAQESRTVYAARQVKDAYAQVNDISANDIFIVTINACVAAKTKTKAAGADCPVDVHLTLHELYRLIERVCISTRTAQEIWQTAKAAPFDNIGVESDNEYNDPDVFPVNASVQEIFAGNRTLSCITVSGLNAAVPILERVSRGDPVCGLLRVKACPGGCGNGGGRIRCYDYEAVEGDNEL